MKGKDADETLKHSSSNLWIKTDILKSQKKHITAAILEIWIITAIQVVGSQQWICITYNLVTSLLKILPCLFKDKALFLI